MVVIGSGPAGEKGAAQAAYFGKRVAVVEHASRPGGAVVSTAGVPTKTLRETALYITGFRRRDVYGVSLHLEPETRLEHLRSRTAEVVETMTAAVERNLERHGIELVRGRAALGPDRTVVVHGPGGRERILTADVVLLASGSHPYHPPGIPFDDPDVYDSEQILTVDRPFRSLVVVGRGIVGCEYASIFTALGVEVTMVGGAPPAPMLDAELSRLLAESFERAGMRLLLGRGRPAVARDERGIAVTMPDGEVLRPDKVLLATGRTGNTEGLGLEAAGVAVDGRGRVVVDAELRTTAPGDMAAELVHLGQAALHFGAAIDYFIHTTFHIPTRSEAYKYAAYDGLQRLQGRVVSG